MDKLTASKRNIEKCVESDENIVNIPEERIKSQLVFRLIDKRNRILTFNSEGSVNRSRSLFSFNQKRPLEEKLDNSAEKNRKLSSSQTSDNTTTVKSEQKPMVRTLWRALHRKQATIPEHSVRCNICLSVMPKIHLNNHIRRKHKDNTKDYTSVNIVYEKCDICGFSMRKEDIRAHVERIHGDFITAQNKKDIFIPCKFCEQLLHIDYMVSHQMRRHNSNSIGFMNSEFNDEQINQWLSDGMVIVKYGLLYLRGPPETKYPTSSD